MKKKLMTIILIILSIIFITNIVQAVNITITLPEDIKQVNPTDLQTQALYQQNNIALYAKNEAKDEAVIVVQLENDLTKKIVNLKGIDEESFHAFLKQYNEVVKQDGKMVIKQESYTVADILFINTIFEQTSDEKKIQTEEYYTIVEGKAVIISASFLQKEMDSAKIRQMIDSVNFQEESTSFVKDNMHSIVLILLLLLVGVIYLVKEKNNKVVLEETQKRRLLQKVTQYMTKTIDYSKFKGVLILFVITIVLNIINLFSGILQVILNNNAMLGYDIISKVYVILAILQNGIQLLGIAYIAYRLTKKEVNTIKKIQNTFITILLGVILLTILRLGLQAIVGGINETWILYLASEMQVLAKSAIYLLVWYYYFGNSIRVSVYYGEKSLEQIATEPKKGYQQNVMNKKMMELKIIEYFESQKAFDYANGIYINQLPKEYARSLSLSDLNSKKVIRLKRAKYYLSRKDLESPKAEKRKAVKTVGIILIIYLLLILILG